MPELPEIETIRRQLDKEVVGKRVKAADVMTPAIVHRNGNKKVFAQRLDGTKLKSLARKGDYLVFTLDSGDVLVAGLGETGRLRKHAPKDEREKQTHVIISFTQGGELRFVDPSKKGEMFVTGKAELAETLPELAAAGMDAVDSPVAWTQFARLVMSHDLKVKSFLMDPKIVTGIGNVYSDEILFQAGLRYDRTTQSLSTQEIRRLYRALVETLHDAIKHGGTNVPEAPYIDVHGKGGGFQDYHEVFARDGEACRRCRGVITKAKFANRTVYYCPDCQV